MVQCKNSKVEEKGLFHEVPRHIYNNIFAGQCIVHFNASNYIAAAYGEDDHIIMSIFRIFQCMHHTVQN
jgi:hypothetical protein